MSDHTTTATTVLKVSDKTEEVGDNDVAFSVGFINKNKYE